MSELVISAIVGSLRAESLNRRLAAAIEALAPADFRFVYPDLGALPLYNDDDGQLASVEAFREQIAASDGLLFVTPEYNRSTTPAMKNALDHASRPYGKSVWAGKPGGVLGCSPGRGGAMAAQLHLRQVLGCLDVRVMSQPEAYLQIAPASFHEDGTLTEDVEAFVGLWTERWADWVRWHVAVAEAEGAKA